MDRQQALDQLRIMQEWHEDNGNGPCPDYDAICYAIGVIEEAPEGLDNLIKALEQEHKKLLEMQKALKNVPDTNVGDTISRQAAIDALKTDMAALDHIIQGMSGYDVRLDAYVSQRNQVNYDIDTINNLPTAQPETATVTIGRTRGSVTMWYECDACGEPVDQNDNYCRNCGRKLKHE